MQRRYWTAKEDQVLRYIVQSMEQTNWTIVSLRLKMTLAQSDRNAKQCRQRWLNKLNRETSDDCPWASNEDRIILSQFLKHYKSEKNKWIYISEKINKSSDISEIKTKRSPNQIKNRFYSIVRKGIRRINNKLNKPILPQEIRLIKPALTVKMFEKMSENQRVQFLQIIYNMSSDFPELNCFSQEMQNQKLQKILQSVIELSRFELQTQRSTSLSKTDQKQNENLLKNIKKRKSSLSTNQQQKLQNIKRQNLRENYDQNKYIYDEKVKVQENDIISLFIGSFIQESASLQFQEIDLGF